MIKHTSCRSGMLGLLATFFVALGSPCAQANESGIRGVKTINVKPANPGYALDPNSPSSTLRKKLNEYLLVRGYGIEQAKRIFFNSKPQWVAEYEALWSPLRTHPMDYNPQMHFDYGRYLAMERTRYKEALVPMLRGIGLLFQDTQLCADKTARSLTGQILENWNRALMVTIKEAGGLKIFEAHARKMSKELTTLDPKYERHWPCSHGLGALSKTADGSILAPKEAWPGLIQEANVAFKKWAGI